MKKNTTTYIIIGAILLIVIIFVVIIMRKRRQEQARVAAAQTPQQSLGQQAGYGFGQFLGGLFTNSGSFSNTYNNASDAEQTALQQSLYTGGIISSF